MCSTRTTRRVDVITLASVLLVLVAAACGPLDTYEPPPGPEPANVWMQRRPLNIAHAGGDLEAPHETMYAFRRAISVGADALEMDLRLSSDGEVMVVHDSTVNRTTNGTGPVRDFTAAQLQAFDNAYWFVPSCWSCHDRPVEEYALRGVRTGDVAPPAGYSADDFAIPTLAQVFEAFPERLLDLEIKDGPDAIATADGLAALIDDYDAADQVVVVSFDDDILDHFRTVAPDIDTSPGQETIITWFGDRGPLPGETSLQVPPTYSGIDVVTQQFVDDAHANDLAVYVWFNGDSDDTTESYEALLDIGVDGFITGKPALLQETLDARNSFRTSFARGPSDDYMGAEDGQVDFACPGKSASRCAGTAFMLGWDPLAERFVSLAEPMTIDAARGKSTAITLAATAEGASWAAAHPDGEALVSILASNADTGSTLFTLPVSSP